MIAATTTVRCHSFFFFLLLSLIVPGWTLLVQVVPTTPWSPRSLHSSVTRPMSASVYTHQESEASHCSQIKVLGVCGGIGSGKSSVCQLLVSEFHCLAHIDSDSMAHTVYEPNSLAIQRIAQEFGADLILENGELDRPKLGAIVFATDARDTATDPNTATRTPMQRLEQIVWPHLRTRIEMQIAHEKTKWKDWKKVQGKQPIIIVEAAVLLDAEWQQFLDGVWVVAVAPTVALSRLMEHRGLTEDQALQRMAAQQSRRGIGNLDHEVEARVVTAVIDNNGSLDDLKLQLEKTISDPTVWYGVLPS